VPVTGEVLAAVAGLATIGRVLLLLYTLGNIAYDPCTIVNDPANAPLAIFGLILAPLGLADVFAIAKAVRLARDEVCRCIEARSKCRKEVGYLE
jgi:chitinase